MARQIYIVDARVVDANGTFNHVSGYPKIFDSNGYQGDIEKTRRRADGDMSDAWSDMCKVDTRQVWTVTMETMDGFQLEKKSGGKFPADEPEPEAE